MSIPSEDRWKTAFRTPHGLDEATVPMFGLKNAPGEFQLWIEEVLAEVLGENVCVHIDDMIDVKYESSCLIAGSLSVVRMIVVSLLRTISMRASRNDGPRASTWILFKARTYSRFPRDRTNTKLLVGPQSTLMMNTKDVCPRLVYVPRPLRP